MAIHATYALPELSGRFLVYSIYNTCLANRRYPCFLQLDLTVRKILSNNVPPFILINGFIREKEIAKAQVLFTGKRAVPPQSLMQFWPRTCGPHCPEPHCETVQMPRNGKESAWILNVDGELMCAVSYSLSPSIHQCSSGIGTPREYQEARPEMVQPLAL